MKWDPVIHWMSHVGEGSWASFKRAVLSLAGPSDDAAAEVRRLRMRLSDLGYAEFFVGAAGRWRAFKPLLATSPHLPRRAFLCGGRTPSLIRALRRHAQQTRCEVISLSVDGLFTSHQYTGPVREFAAAAGLGFEPNIPLRLSTQLTPIDMLLRAAVPRSAPRSWSVSSFDFDTFEWIDGYLRDTVVEYTSPYQERLYLLARGSETVELPKREAMYAAASLVEIRLAEYVADSRELRVPWVAPLPEPFARAACVAAGRPSIMRDGLIVYEDVPPRLATVLLVGVGQLAPRFHFCGPRRRDTGARAGGRNPRRGPGRTR